MAPSRMAGVPSQTSASSDNFFQGESQSHNGINSHLSSPFGNFASSISGTGRSNLGPISGDIVNHSILNSAANSGPSVGASSLVTDANSAFSEGSQFHRSASTNTDSYLRLPASPMSFSSNNISTSTSSVLDGSPQQAIQTQHKLHQGVSCVNSLSSPLTGGQLPLAMGPRITNSFVQDPAILSPLSKKPRLNNKQEDIFQQQVLQQLLQRQDGMQLQGHNPQLQAILHQQRLRQQQQLLQFLPQMQRVHLQQQQLQQLQQQQQLRQHLQQQQMAVMKNPYDTGGVCARRLMQYLYHQRQRPPANSIAYWKKFVAEYYAPRAKKRWCLSQYDTVGHHAIGAFPLASMDVWSCDICGSKSGRGFEATYEVLPRLNEIKFGSGVIGEHLFVDLPRERKLANGFMILEYVKAVQESVYEQLRVVREGQLRIIFTQELKILSWDFCARRHEELLPRRVLAPQVKQLLHVAQKCQSSHADSESDCMSSQDLQTNSNMVVAASRQLAKSLELQSLNDLGFSKRYVRCLQIAEVVNSMKDLIDLCSDNNIGPIEGLKNFPRHAASTSNLQNRRIQETDDNHCRLPTDRNAINKLVSVQNHPGISNPNSAPRVGQSGPAAAAMALTNYPNITNSGNTMATEPQQQQSPGLQQHLMIEQLLKSVSGSFNSSGQQKLTPTLDNGVGRPPYTPPASCNLPGGVGPTLSKTDSDSSAGCGANGGFNNNNNNNNNNLRLTDDTVPELPRDFAEGGFFSNDFDEVGSEWYC